MRIFETGATRDSNTDKPDFRGFLSIPVLRLFGRYMHKHRLQADGKLRDSDNWKKGIPQQAYIESGWRHWLDVVEAWERSGGKLTPELEESLGAMLFNVQGLAHELLKEAQHVGTDSPKRIAVGTIQPLKIDDILDSISRHRDGCDCPACPY